MAFDPTELDLEPIPTRCPKCGYSSADPGVCDACGAVFAKVRAKEIEEEKLGPLARARLGVFPSSRPSSFWTKLVLAVALVAIGGIAYRVANAPVYIQDLLIELSDEKEPTGEEQGFLVEFWASWSVPCKTFAPVIEEVENRYGEHLRVIRVDADLNPKLANAMHAKELPTVLLFDSKGLLQKRLVGARRKQALESQINRVLGLEYEETQNPAAPATQSSDQATTAAP